MPLDARGMIYELNLSLPKTWESLERIFEKYFYPLESSLEISYKTETELARICASGWMLAVSLPSPWKEFEVYYLKAPNGDVFHFKHRCSLNDDSEAIYYIKREHHPFFEGLLRHACTFIETEREKEEAKKKKEREDFLSERDEGILNLRKLTEISEKL